MSAFNQYVPLAAQRLHRAFPNLTRLDLAAVFGNAGHESAGFEKLQEIRPTIKGSRGGFGWFQWTGPRRRAFEAFCKQRGLKPASFDANVNFLIYELQHTERTAIPKMLAAKTLEAKVKAFELGYERAGVKHYPSRIQWAYKALALIPAAPGGTLPIPRPNPAPRNSEDEAPAEVMEPGPILPDMEVFPDMQLPETPQEPGSFGQSTTIWSAIAAFLSSGAGMVLAYINSVWGFLAFAVVVGAVTLIILQRMKHRREAGI